MTNLCRHDAKRLAGMTATSGVSPLTAMPTHLAVACLSPPPQERKRKQKEQERIIAEKQEELER